MAGACVHATASKRDTGCMSENVVCYFDAVCPWTWLTLRWLVDIAPDRDLTIAWKPLSLPMLNEGQSTPEKFQDAMRASLAFHRVMIGLDEAGQGEQIGALYTAWGEATFSDGAAATPDLVTVVARELGVSEAIIAMVDDAELDAKIRLSHDEGIELAGPDIGSPVIRIGATDHAFSGPVIDAVPDHDAGVRLWDLVVGLHALPDFYELKRGRRGGPRLDSVRSSKSATTA